MKMQWKTAVGILALVTTVGAGCVVYPAGTVRGPDVRVRYHSVSGARVLVVPRTVQPGHYIVISGNRCLVHKVRSNRIRVMYPDGRRVWINCRYR